MTSMIRQASRMALCFGMLTVLSACGGGDGNSGNSLTDNPVVTQVSGGQWLGFYREALDTGDPDPALGTVYLNTSEGASGSFKGRMSFQYQDCQKINDIAVRGDKTQGFLTGTASGDLDSLSLRNPDTSFGGATNLTVFKGTYSQAASGLGFYAGDYSRSGRGNDRRLAEDCSPPYEYTLGSKGIWSVFPMSTRLPADFSVRVAERQLIQWSGISVASATIRPTTAVIAVLDPVAMLSGSNNAFVRQVIVPLSSADGSGSINALRTATGLSRVQATLNYRVVVQVFDQNRELIGLTSSEMTFLP